MNDAQRPSAEPDPNIARFARAGRDPAPDSPRIQSWQKRILGWGCAPAMAIGMVGGLVGTARPELAQTMAMLGAGMAILGAGPILLHTRRLRQDNRKRWNAAHDRAQAEGLEVRVVTTEEGDHDYRLVEAEKLERIDWDARGGEVEGAASADTGDSPTEAGGSSAGAADRTTADTPAP